MDISYLGDFYAPVLDSTNAAWLHYNITEADGTNHFKVDRGSVMFWFAPDWSGTNQGGTGPGEWSRLIEIGSYTTNASYGWWSVYTDPEGVNIYFSAQTNGAGTTYLTAPISWNVTNRWHLIALTYSDTNTALYLDSELVTNGSPITLWPGPDVLTNGFFVGSDSNGLSQAHGMFDDLWTYDYAIDQPTVINQFMYYGAWYFLNPWNKANYASAPSTSSISPTFIAVTGSGYLTAISTNATGCVSNNNIWITNVVATVTNNGTMNLKFTIAGGSDGVLYDVFANSVLDFSSNTNFAWGWMGQGYHCVTYLLTNLPITSAFVILGQPYDPDGDGLTSAYEKLVSKTDPLNPSTSGDGILDGWKIVWGLDPLLNHPAQPTERSNYTYDLTDWLNVVSGVRSGSITLDPEGNIQQSSQ